MKEVISVPPQSEETPKGIIVMMHGWGANSEDLASLPPFLKLPEYHFFFPNAPYPHPYNPVGRSWYELRNENMYQGLAESRQMIVDWLQSLEKATGVPLSKTILSGFSQGGAMTIDIGLSLPVAGFVSMSGYLHPGAVSSRKNTSSPALIMHGRQDEVVPLTAAMKVKETLESLLVRVQYHEFDMGHEIQAQNLELFRNFVIQVISD
ncbi:MAG: dienelactone hydrolase family protein [Cyanobacteria bacterium P01_A01_bin.84]